MRSYGFRLAALVAAVALLGALASAPPASAAAGFGDVADNAFYAAPVQWLVDESITAGTSPGCFSPERPVTRGEIATFLWRYAGEPAIGTEGFTDVHSGDFFRDAVAWMSTTGITTGTTATTFEPYRPVTRGETATFLWRHAGSPTVTTIPGGTCGAQPTNQPGAPTTTPAAPSGPTPPAATTPPATTASTTTTSTTTTTTISPPPPSGDRFETLPPGSALPSGQECAQRVRSAPETRPNNTPYNNTVGASAHPDYPRVDGNFTGTTDEILQWAACKWGFDEDIVRAQVAKESWWDQQGAGDLSSNPNDCHPSVRHLSPCPESLGILQVRYLYHTPAMNDSIASTAYNADYTYAALRSCYEGNETWLNDFERGGTYGPGDLWGCLGTWFTGRWRIDPALQYIDAVQDLLDQRVWEQQYFLNA